METKIRKKKSKGFKLFIVAFICILLLFSKKENQEKLIDFINSAKIANKTLKVVETIPIEDGIENIYFYEKGIMKWGNKKLTRLKIDGSTEWEKEFNFDEPLTVFGENNIYVCEKATGDIYFLSSTGETVNRVELKSEISNITESFESIFTHIKETNMESIIILDRRGEIIGNTLVEDKNILTYCMNQDNTIYSISTLNLNDNNLKSETLVYHLNGELLFSTQFNNEIVLYTNFVQKDKLIVMTDKGLYALSGGNVLWKKQFQLIKDIYIDKNKVYILYGNTLECISIDGRTEEKQSFTEEYKKIFHYDKHIILYGEEYIRGFKNDHEVFKYKGQEEILRVLQGKQNLIIIYRDKIEIVSL